jgi:hypothetical protein
MVEETKVGRRPDFKGDGVAVWVNEKDGKKYLSINVLGSIRLAAFKNEPKEKVPVVETKVTEEDMSELI